MKCKISQRRDCGEWKALYGHNRPTTEAVEITAFGTKRPYFVTAWPPYANAIDRQIKLFYDWGPYVKEKSTIRLIYIDRHRKGKEKSIIPSEKRSRQNMEPIWVVLLKKDHFETWYDKKLKKPSNMLKSGWVFSTRIHTLGALLSTVLEVQIANISLSGRESAPASCANDVNHRGSGGDDGGRH